MVDQVVGACDGEPNRKLMLKTNPKYVLRNWMAQLAIDAAERVVTFRFVKNYI